MVPEMTGDFGPLVRLIFDSAAYVKSGAAYSELQIKEIVNICNDLYTKYKSVDKVVDAFITEVNRRYGVFKKNEYDAYVKRLQELRGESPHSDPQAVLQGVDFELFGEEEYDNTKRLAPSDRYMRGLAQGTDKQRDLTFNIDEVYRKLIWDFRRAIEVQLENVTNAKSSVNWTFRDAIKQHKSELRASSTEEERFQVIVKAIHITGNFTSIGGEKLLLFHELVIVPLSILAGINTVVEELYTEIFPFNTDASDAGLGAMTTVEQISLIFNGAGSLDKLVTFNATSSGVTLEYSQLTELIQNLINHVKYFLDRFRGSIHDDLLKPYLDVGVKNSVYWLEDKLLDKRLLGKRQVEVDRVWRTQNLASLSEGLNNLKRRIGKNTPDTNEEVLDILSKAMITRFNDVVSYYLNSIQDATNVSKVYSPLVDTFAADGPWSGKTLSTNWGHADGAFDVTKLPDGVKTFDDVDTADDKLSLILNTRNSGLLNYILTAGVSAGKPAVKRNIVASLTEVYHLTREGYKVILPTVIRNCQLLKKQVELIKMFMDHMGLKVTGTKDQVVLDNLMRGCSALINAASKVLKELTDSPVFFETSKDFLKDYGGHPYMPLSQLTHVFNLDNVLVKSGTSEFRYLYGIRGLWLHGENGSVNNMPGMKELLGMHNRLDAKYDINATNVDKFLHDVTEAARYLIDMHHIQSKTSDAWFNVTEIRGDADAVKGPWQIQRNIKLDNVLDLTESTFKSDKQRQIIAYVTGKLAAISASSVSTTEYPDLTRSVARVLNIVDLNRVPINVNALMRDIPLAPTYNYAYTFDSMILELLNLNAPEVMDQNFNIKPIAPGDALKANQLFASLLINPYMSIDITVPQESLNAIATNNGNQINHLGRPKFLYDQFFGKGLLMLPSLKANEPYNRNKSKGKIAATIEIPKNTRPIAARRFDTLFARNTMWFVLLQRALRLKLREELVHVDAPVVKSSAVVSEDVTEIYDHYSDQPHAWNRQAYNVDVDPDPERDDKGPIPHDVPNNTRK
jgi:hypothetical protein